MYIRRYAELASGEVLELEFERESELCAKCVCGKSAKRVENNRLSIFVE